MPGHVRTRRDGAIGWLVFDHPERRNAITARMWQEIPGAAAELAADPDVRVVVMRGAGDVAFVSGADISEFEETRVGSAAADYDAANRAAFEALAGIDKPVIAMVHGFCVGGGLALALTADLRWTAEDGVFAIPAARLGLGYGAAGVRTLLDLVGPSAAKEILFTARRIGAHDALRMGLVNRVTPKAALEAEVRELAGDIAANAPLTLRSAKIVVRELLRDPGERDVQAMEASIRACFASDDYREGIRAFLEKRAPRFRGR